MHRKIITVLLSLFFPTFLLANETPNANQTISPKQKTIDYLVEQYYESKVLEAFLKINHQDASNKHRDDCEPRHGSTSCVEAACDALGQFGCDDMSEIRSVTAACRGTSGRCVAASCDALGKFGCDDMSEIRSVTAACKGSNGRCVAAACNALGQFGCDDMSEIRSVTTACKGVDGRCVRSVCENLGRFGCDDMSEIRSVTATCKR